MTARVSPVFWPQGTSHEKLAYLRLSSVKVIICMYMLKNLT